VCGYLSNLQSARMYTHHCSQPQVDAATPIAALGKLLLLYVDRANPTHMPTKTTYVCVCESHPPTMSQEDANAGTNAT
jgi:hypothetical protein